MGVGGLYDTHDTYDTHYIIIWKIGMSFALIGAKYTYNSSYASWAGGTLYTRHTCSSCIFYISDTLDMLP